MYKTMLKMKICSRRFGGIRKHAIVTVTLLLLTVFGLGGCGGADSVSTTPTPTDSSQSPGATPTQAPLNATSLVTSVSPVSFDGISCGSTTSFTFSTIITVTGNGGGQVAYTWNIGSSHIPGSVMFAPGETSQTVTYTLKETNIQPSTAGFLTGSLSVNMNGKMLSSTPASVLGICAHVGTLKVVSLTVSVSPTTITGVSCFNVVSFVYTAIVTIAPNSDGGDVVLKWSFSNSPVALTFGPYQPGAPLTQSITYTLSGKLLYNNAFPPPASISSTIPNTLTSATVKPAGPCIPLK